MKSYDGKLVRQYLGIPFAKPPIGTLRFKHPQPVDAWDDVLEATELPPSCTQKAFPGEKIIKFLSIVSPSTPNQEDCLYLNVYVPDKVTSKTAVIVFIYGGAFSVGSASTLVFDGTTLATEENVIVVNFNYRLNLFGFLYMDHPDMDTNCGLMDQVLAMKWVRDNVASFGGDPDNITLMGHSAGSACVGLHMISNISRNYFNRGIMQSGSPVAEWVTQEKEENLAFGRQLVEYYGCPDKDNVSAVVRCLKEATTRDLMSNEPARDFDTSIFRPVIDGVFIREELSESMRKGDFKQTDILLGTNRNEASPFLVGLMPFVFSFLSDSIKPYYEDFLQLVPETLRYASPAALQAVIYEYTPWKDKDDFGAILRSCNNLFSDYYFNCAANDMSKYVAEAGSAVYQYYYAHTSDEWKLPKWMGSFHGHEIPYVFGYTLDPKYKLSSRDKSFSKRVMRYWANFARTGNPNMSPDGREETIEWPRYTLDNREALVLGYNVTAVVTNHRRKACAFWSEYLPYIENLVKLGKLDKRVLKWT